MQNYLADLTDEQLAERLAKIEKMGKETAALVASGDRGEPVGYVIVRGVRRVSYRYEEALNWQRGAWKETRKEIRRRAGL